MRQVNTITTTTVFPRGDCLAECGRDFFASIGEALRSFSSFLFEAPPSFTAASSPAVEGTRDCVLVLDESGSMLDDDWKPTRLDAARTAAKAFVLRLSKEQPDARIAVVAFGSRAKIICPLTAARETDRISRAIDQIVGDGCTNMHAGLKAALDLLKNRRRSCQVVLLTDGHSTDKNPEEPANALKAFSVIECVGIGGKPSDVDESLLKRIASADHNGRKRYRWIGQKEQLIRHFHNLAGAIRRA